MSASSNTKTMTTKAATTYNTSTSNQTIASGTYLTGAQTIRAVTTSNLSAANIKKGVAVKVGDAGSAGRIASITGTYLSSMAITLLYSGTSITDYTTYTITSTDVSTYKYIIAIGGGGDGTDKAPSVSFSTSGTITKLYSLSKASTQSAGSAAGACGIAIYSGFATGAKITISPHWWGSAIIVGAKFS